MRFNGMPSLQHCSRTVNKTKYLSVVLLLLLGIVVSLGYFKQNVKQPPFGSLYGNNEKRPPVRPLYDRTIPTTRRKAHNTMYTTGKTTSVLYGTDQHNYEYKILEKGICKVRNDTDVFLLIVVCISPEHTERRKAIRETWGATGKYDPKVRIVFLSGVSKNSVVQNQLNNERKQHGDIVQEDFADTYRNLSIKSVALLKWASQYCRNAKYVLKVDSDMFVNVNNLIHVLKKRNLSNSVLGIVTRGAHVFRDKVSKYYTPPELYRPSVFPDYCLGGAYVLSSDIVPKLFEVSKKIPVIPSEDVFITGICRVAIGVNIVNVRGFTNDKPNPDGCTFRKWISGHQYSLQELRKIWKEINDAKVKCK